MVIYKDQDRHYVAGTEETHSNRRCLFESQILASSLPDCPQELEPPAAAVRLLIRWCSLSLEGTPSSEVLCTP